MPGDTVVHALSVDRATGSLRIDGIDAPISPGMHKNKVEALLKLFFHSQRDHRNGYEWLDFSGLTFGNYPCGLSLCFHNGNFVQAGWSVDLPGAPMEGGWPTRAAIDDEIQFVRAHLAELLEGGSGRGTYRWGTIWSGFDDKGFTASNGIRYTQPLDDNL